jgi:hypothetical protein
MRKFTIFTAMLTIVVVVVVAEIAVNKYLPELGEGDSLANLELSLPDDLDLAKITRTSVLDSGLGNRLGADVNRDAIPKDLKVESGGVEKVERPVVEDIDLDSFLEDLDETSIEDFGFSSGFNEVDIFVEEEESDLPDFEDENFAYTAPNVFIRQEQVVGAGFKDAYLEEQAHNGYLFKNISIGDLFDVEMDKTIVRTEETLYAKTYVMRMGPNSNVNDVYNVLKIRADELLNTEINETNEFGVTSFYMNDARRSGTSFLIVRIDKYIYGFSYPKDFHSQIKNLLKLLEWEFEN